MTEQQVTRVAIATEKFLKVPLDDVIRNVGDGVIVNSIIRTLIKPELEKRGMGKFRSAIVEIFPKDKQPPKFHFDDDCMFAMKLKEGILKPEMKGRYLFQDCGVTMDDVENIALPQNFGDPNSAKLFVVRFDPFFFLFFDFRYNRQRVEAQLARAKEYITAARKLDPEAEHAPICDMLWAAMEMMAQAMILSLPDGEKTKTHDKLEHLDDLRKGLVIVSDDFMRVFAQVSKKRPAARYPDVSSDPSWQERSKPLSPKEIAAALANLEKELENNVMLKI
ncbi:MAG: HEPN domain-containing protein [Candidatus Peregrinibacteria bacterium]